MEDMCTHVCLQDQTKKSYASMPWTRWSRQANEEQEQQSNYKHACGHEYDRAGEHRYRHPVYEA